MHPLNDGDFALNLRNAFRSIAWFCLLLLPGVASAQTNIDKPLRADLSLGGNYTAGNLNQLQAYGSARLSYAGDQAGADIFANAFRFWMQPGAQNTWRQIGDELALMGYPYYYFHPRFFLHGFARYDTSMLHRLDARLVGGGGVGIAPFRSSNQNEFARLSLGAYAEYAAFPGTDFTREIPHEKGSRTLARLGFLSNGHFASADQFFAFRYLVYCFVDPFLPRDIRFGFTTNGDVKIWGPLSFRLSTDWVYNSVVLTSVQPYDFRATFGLAWHFKN